MIFRKMLQNKWLVASLFIGLLVSNALVSTMPIYSEAVLSRMLVKDLETLQTTRNVYPGAQYNRVNFNAESPETINSIFNNMEQFVHNQAPEGFQIPVQEIVTELQSRAIRIRSKNDPNPESTKSLMPMVLRSY